MPKCNKCGKKFDSLQALNDHFRRVHPSERFVAPKTNATKNLTIGLVVVIIVIGSLVGYLIYMQEQQSTTTSPDTSFLGQVISNGLYNNLTGVSDSTLAAIGSYSSASSPTSISGTPLVGNGKPLILYIGADWCPYCAAERWALIVALSKFGTFSRVTYMLSSASDTPASIPTFSFYNSTYTSKYITFVSVEYQDRLRNPLQTISQNESALMTQYDSSRTIPYVNFANKYLVNGAQFSPPLLSNLNWSQIAAQLNNPNSGIAKAIDGSANKLITAICKIDGGNPSNVCDQPYANIALSLIPNHIGQASFAINTVRKDLALKIEEL